MNIKYLSCLIAVVPFMAFSDDNADCPVGGRVVNTISVEAPDMGEPGVASVSGNLGALVIDTKYSDLQIDFTVNSTADYETQLKATTDCLTDEGEGKVELKAENAHDLQFAVTETTDTFVESIGYDYTTPSSPNLQGTNCTITLDAWYN